MPSQKGAETTRLQSNIFPRFPRCRTAPVRTRGRRLWQDVVAYARQLGIGYGRKRERTRGGLFVRLLVVGKEREIHVAWDVAARMRIVEARVGIRQAR